MPAHLLSLEAPLTLVTLADLLASGETVALTPGAAAGFAPAAGPAPAPELAALRAGACGTGPEVPQSLVRLMLLLTAHQLINQPAGLAMSTAERLLALYNRELLPVVFEQGGDAAARAHLALPLLGEGEVNYQGYRLATADALSLFSWAPLALRAGEAAALGRGAPFALAYAADALLRARRLLGAAPAVRALSPGAVDDATGPTAVALAAAEQAVNGALRYAPGPLALALGALAEAVAALGRASAGRTGQLAAALGTGAAGLAAHSLVASQSIGAESDAYAAQRTRQLVENAEQLLGMELLAAAQAREAGPGAGGAAESGGGLLAAFRAAVPAPGPGQAPYPALRLAAAFVRGHAWGA